MRRMFSLKQLQEIADSEVKSLVEGGTLENAKPIYCHPITLTRAGTSTLGNMRLTCLIFNNDETPFTPTTLKEWIDNLVEQIGAVRIMVSGGCEQKTQSRYVISASCLAAYKSGDNMEYDIQGIIELGAFQEIYGSWLEVFGEDLALSDNVNKIN